MLPCEQYAEEVSQEAEGLKDSPELSPTLAMTAQLPCQSLWPQPSFRNGIPKLNSNLLVVRKECLSTTAIKKSASFSAEISIYCVGNQWKVEISIKTWRRSVPITLKEVEDSQTIIFRSAIEVTDYMVVVRD
ncbi:unnamed protein product [Bubo scandiacus]